MFSGKAALVTFFGQGSERQAVDGVQKIFFFCDFPYDSKRTKIQKKKN